MLYGASVYAQMVSLHVKPYYQPYDSDNGGAAHFLLPTREESSDTGEGPWPGQPFRWLLLANNSGVPVCSKVMQVCMLPINRDYLRGIDIPPGDAGLLQQGNPSADTWADLQLLVCADAWCS